MDDRARQRLVDDVERWFVRRGLPHAIDDYSARDDVLTRTAPFLLLVLLVEVVITTFGDRFTGWGQAGASVAAATVVLGGFALVNRLRRRRTFQLPDSVGIGEMAIFLFVPAGLALVFDRSRPEALLLGGTNLVLAGLAFGLAYFGVLPMIIFGLRQVWRRLRTLTQLLARVLPLLLLFVMFVFLTAEMWQVANDFTPVAYSIVTLTIAGAALGFVAVRLPVEVEQLARFESWEEVCRVAARSGSPALPPVTGRSDAPTVTLDRRDRRNVSVLLFVSYAVQVVLIGLIVAAVLVVFGVLAIRETTIRQWTVQDTEQVATLWRFRLLGAQYVLTWPHLAVSGFIGVFSMLQFAVQLLRDQDYREEFSADVSGDIREVLAVQLVYEQVMLSS